MNKLHWNQCGYVENWFAWLCLVYRTEWYHFRGNNSDIDGMTWLFSFTTVTFVTLTFDGTSHAAQHHDYWSQARCGGRGWARAHATEMDIGRRVSTAKYDHQSDLPRGILSLEMAHLSWGNPTHQTLSNIGMDNGVKSAWISWIYLISPWSIFFCLQHPALHQMSFISPI